MITGFMPETASVFITDEELFPIASVDFSKNTEMYDALKDKIENTFDDSIPKENMILDDEFHTIWIIW